MGYKATLTVACFKQHTCVACESKYGYILQRQVTAEGSNEQKAVESAETQAANALNANVDVFPCPNCGVVQPEMAAVGKSRRTWWAIIVGALGIGLALLLGHLEVFTIETSAYLAAGVAIVTLLLFARAAFYNPNKNTDTNRINSEAKVAAQQLFLDEKSAVRPGTILDTRAGGKAAQMIALLFSLGAVVAVVAPVALSKMNGWAQNDGCRPAVCGAGDTVRVYFDSEITSVKGYWNGSTEVHVTNVQEVGLAPGTTLSGTTKSSNWGNTISGDSVSESTNRMWVDVDVLDNADLAEKTLQLDLSVDARFPYAMPGKFYDERSQTFRHQTALALSAPNVGALYHKSWWLGQVVAIGGVIFCGILMLSACGALKRRGNPTAVATLDGEDDTPPNDVVGTGNPIPPQA